MIVLRVIILIMSTVSTVKNVKLSVQLFLYEHRQVKCNEKPYFVWFIFKRKLSVKLYPIRFENKQKPISLSVWCVHPKNFFRNLIKSTWNKIVYTIFRLIWYQTDVRLVPNKSENGKYNLISAWFNMISKTFLYVHQASRIKTWSDHSKV